MTQFDKEQLLEREKLRFLILKAIYDEVVGQDQDTAAVPFTSDSVADGLGLSKVKVERALEYSENEGLVKLLGYEGQPLYILTHQGLLEVEHAIKFPNQPTRHFMLAVVQHFHAAVGSVQNGPDATANVEQKTE